MIDHLGFGGAQTVLLNIVRYLNKDDFDVHVCALRGGRELQAQFEELDIQLLCYPRSRLALPFTFVDFVKRLRAERFDILHLHLEGAQVFGYLARPWTGSNARCLVHEHRTVAELRSYLGLTRRCARNADLLIACSRGVARQAEEMYQLPAERIATLYNTIDLESFDRCVAKEPGPIAKLQDGIAVVGWTGRLSREKGLDILLEAWRLVLTRMDAQLLLVGSGPLAAELCRQARDLNIEDRVVFAGFRDDVPAILARLDLYVQPSRDEGFGVSVAEAMAARLATVASDIPGLDEVVVHEQTGLLVSPGSPDALADGITSLLGDREKMKAMGQAARQRVERLFDARANTRELEHIYRRVLDMRARRGGTVSYGRL